MNNMSKKFLLPEYLDDVLEKSVFEHSMTARDVGALGASFVSAPDDPLIEKEFDQRSRRLTQNALFRLSPQAADHAEAVHSFLSEEAPGSSRKAIIAHLLRELDSLIRGTWWEISCFIDDQAQKLRLDAMEKDRNARNAPHRQQVEYLAAKMKLTDVEIKAWVEAGKLHKDAHKGALADIRTLTDLDRKRFTDSLLVIEKVAKAAEESYGIAMMFASQLASTAPPREAPQLLKHTFPAHLDLRHWFMSEVDHPDWLRPLHTANFMDDIRAMDEEKLIIPISQGSRTVARMAPQVVDKNLISHLYSKWIECNNPSIHTDMIQIMIKCPLSMDLELVPRLLEWLKMKRFHATTTRVKGAGLVRFPSHCLRLADHLIEINERKIGINILRSLAQSLYFWASSKEDFENQVNLALLGAGNIGKLTKSGFLKFCRREITND